MVAIKAYTDINQSRKLAEVLPIESADMHIIAEDLVDEDTGDIISIELTKFGAPSSFEIPCWSLSALLNILPEIQGGKPIISLDDNYITYPHMSDLHTKADNIVDACYEMILKLNKLNLL